LGLWISRAIALGTPVRNRTSTLAQRRGQALPIVKPVWGIVLLGGRYGPKYTPPTSLLTRFKLKLVNTEL
jgi:hypothetical protein